MPRPRLPVPFPDLYAASQSATSGLDRAVERMFGGTVRAQSPRAIPAGPFYWAVARADRIPIAPMSSNGEGIDEPATPRAAPGTPINHEGEVIKPYGDLLLEPERATVGWPLRLYELRDLEGTGWEDDSRGSWFYAMSAVVGREAEAWRYFGPHGDGIPELLEQVWRLEPQQVAALGPARPPRCPEAIPIPLLAKPGGIVQRGVQNAVECVMNWTENRSWAVGDGGGFYYRGCYLTYVVSDPNWLTAMGLAYNAAVAIAGGPAIDAVARQAALAAWRQLVGDGISDGQEENAGRYEQRVR
jgi:hypothetical protein